MEIGALILAVALRRLVLSLDQIILVPVPSTLPPPNTRFFQLTGEKSLLATLLEAVVAERVY